MTPGSSRHTHALDATITKALAPFFPLRPFAISLATVAVRDALLAEGHIGYEGRDRLVRGYPARDWQRVLVIPLDADS